MDTVFYKQIVMCYVANGWKGNWKEDMKHCYGTAHYNLPDQHKKYCGEWKKNQRYNYGVFFRFDEKSYEGELINIKS